jgi:hypothetical protein
MDQREASCRDGSAPTRKGLLMRHPTSPLSVELYQREVERMAEAKAPFGEVEDKINAAELATDEKAALWMLAWSLLAPATQEAEARVMLALVAGR